MQLTHVGLTELIAGSADDYVRIAQSLAGDWPRLAELRAGRFRAVRRMEPGVYAPVEEAVSS